MKATAFWGCLILTLFLKTSVRQLWSSETASWIPHWTLSPSSSVGHRELHRWRCVPRQALPGQAGPPSAHLPLRLQVHTHPLGSFQWLACAHELQEAFFLTKKAVLPAWPRWCAKVGFLLGTYLACDFSPGIDPMKKLPHLFSEVTIRWKLFIL